MSIAVGARLGSHEILGLLGAGGMGVFQINVVLNWFDELRDRLR